MKHLKTEIPGVMVIEPDVFGDQRGFFMETWHLGRYEELGLHNPFVQDNLSRSKKGVLRGLHFQNPNPQGKLVSVVEGEVFDVCVDIRRNSPTFGRWFATILSLENKKQMYIPEGLAHGFCVTSDSAIFSYKCTEYYNPKAEKTLLWNDPELGIDWPSDSPIVSQKDREGLPLANLDVEQLVAFKR